MDQNSPISLNLFQSDKLRTYLQSNQIDRSLENLPDKILHLLQQKDEQIKVLSGQITKYKAQQIKNNKIVVQLQQKINRISPNTNNTSSSFMMASEFKDFFDDFMRNTLPACVSPLISFPKACSEYVGHLLNTVYSQIQQKISKKTSEICQILSLECSSENSTRIRSCLLKVMQDNWQQILQFNNESQTPSQYIQKALIFSNEQVQQIIQSEQFIELDKKIIKICAYMILQQQKWKFVTFQHRVQLYTKKQHNYIDGWIKQQDQVIILVEGISKINEEGNLLTHPNLRNYVIPYFQENYIFKEIALAKVENKEDVKIRLIDQQCQYSPKIQRKQLDQIDFGELNKENEAPKNNQELENKLKKNSSCSNLPKKCTISLQKEFSEKADQKVSTEIRKLSKGSNKMSAIIQVDSVSILLSPHVPKGSKNSNNTLKIGNCEIVENQPIVQNYSNLTKSSKLKSSKNSHNLISDPSFEDFVPMPHKKRDYVDQLPLKRDTSRNKKSNSRKASAGKIVGQVIEQKENRINKENIVKQKDSKQNMNKDVLYKDIIKQKLGSDFRTERERQKESKVKEREEDRPLRLNIKKLRQKVNF